jgi:hypothetical protein
MDFINVVENAIPPDYCKHLIDKYEKTPGKHQGCLGVGKVDTSVKKTTDLHPGQYIEWNEDCVKIDTYIGDSVVKYIEYLKRTVFDGDDFILRKMFECTDVLEPTGIQIQRYTPGEYFNWHCDDAFGKKRLIAYIIYLNSMNEDDGGRTQFLHGKNIIPKVGSILFFPSTWSYIHRGESVRNGKKYIITGFINEVLPESN